MHRVSRGFRFVALLVVLMLVLGAVPAAAAPSHVQSGDRTFFEVLVAWFGEFLPDASEDEPDAVALEQLSIPKG